MSHPSQSESDQEDVEDTLTAGLQEMEQVYKVIPTPIRSYLLASVALALATWSIAFNLGVYQIIFFNHLFFVWVASTATLIAGIFLRQDDAFFDTITLLALLVPSAWLLTEMLLPTDQTDVSALMNIWLFVMQIATVLSLPYLAFTLLYLTQPDTFVLPRRLQGGLVAVVLAMTLLGYVLGSNHRLFLTCHDFQISGNDTPINCVAE